MLNKFYSLFAIIAVCLCLSCSDSNEEPVYSMGKVTYYDNFWGYNYKPDTLKKKLVFEFCEDATEESTSFVMGFFAKEDDTSSPMETDIAQLYVNGEIAENNQFEISNIVNGAIVKKVNVELGIVFNPEAESKQHHWEIKVLDTDKHIEEVLIEDGITDVINFDAEKENIMNPLKKRLIWGSTIFFALCLVWYIVSRFMLWRSTPFSKVSISYSDGSERTIRMRGGYSLVCTANTKTKDSLLSKIFKGSKTYEYNDFWTYPIELNRGSKRRSVSIVGRKKYTVDGVMERRRPIEIINENGDKAIIQTT